MKALLNRPFFIKLLHREYWSFNAVYIWIMPVWAWLGIRSRSFFFFAAANPSIEYGGFLMESKKKIYDLLPPRSYPPTHYFKANESPALVLQQLRDAGFRYPLIGKPDIGGQGRGVQKLDTETALLAYAQSSPLDFLVQEYIDHPHEAGIFYYRYPGEKKGRISGIVRKEMLSVKGDGRRTLRELLLLDKRYILQLPVLEKTYGALLDEVLPAGKRKERQKEGRVRKGNRETEDNLDQTAETP